MNALRLREVNKILYVLYVYLSMFISSQSLADEINGMNRARGINFYTWPRPVAGESWPTCKFFYVESTRCWLSFAKIGRRDRKEKKNPRCLSSIASTISAGYRRFISAFFGGGDSVFGAIFSFPARAKYKLWERYELREYFYKLSLIFAKTRTQLFHVFSSLFSVKARFHNVKRYGRTNRFSSF